MRKCPKCEELIELTAIKCDHCGFELPDIDVKGISESFVQPGLDEGKFSVVCIIIGAICAAVLGIISLIMCLFQLNAPMGFIISLLTGFSMLGLAFTMLRVLALSEKVNKMR